MQKFKEKTGVVDEAVQITDATFDTPHPNPEHIQGVIYDPVNRCVKVPLAFVASGKYVSPVGYTTGYRGDWIVRQANGLLYVMPSDVFAATYEPA